MKLFSDLQDPDISPWINKFSIQGGRKWEVAIREAIKTSRYFITLLSNYSLSKRGFVQAELKKALSIQNEFPATDIYIISVRLHHCIPEGPLSELHWVDLFPSWEEGIKQIKQVLKYLPQEPLVDSSDMEWPIYQIAFLWYGKQPPSPEEHWHLMTPQIYFTKQLLHDAVNSGKLKASREYRFSSGITRFIERKELIRFAKTIGELPLFLRE